MVEQVVAVLVLRLPLHQAAILEVIQVAQVELLELTKAAAAVVVLLATAQPVLMFQTAETMLVEQVE